MVKQPPDEPAITGAISDDEVVDELPEDLDVTSLDGEYTIPNNNRRRIPAAMYLVLGSAAAGAAVVLSDESPYVNGGLLGAGVLLGLFGVFGMVAGRTLLVDETEALVAASAQVGFAVGHASAQMVWRGLLSRPVWRLLLYSNENPPARRGFVLVDGIDGSVVEWMSEENPEHWDADATVS